MAKANGDPAVKCPNCEAEMERVALEGVYGAIEVDLCFPCHVLWLDRRESIQLAPGGTLELFRVLHERGDEPRDALKARLSCPRCRSRLSLSRDIGKGGRFSYYACPKKHGRLEPFSEFLKEKQFVRALSPAEEHKLRAEVKQVQCSSCGAPVDLVQGFACQHCGSPLTVLDSEAIEKTLRELEEADAVREAKRADPAAAEARARALAALETLRTDPNPDEPAVISITFGSRAPRSSTTDLLSVSISRLFGGL